MQVRNYLVVDLAVFAQSGTVSLTPSYFSLRINGSKAAILAQQPFVVANSFDPPRAGASQPGLSAGASTGNVGVIVGPPGQPGTIGSRRMPDPQNPNPQPPPRPETPNPYVVDRAPAATPHEQVERAALPSGDVVPPISGALFFAYTGKPESIRTIELLYEGPAGQASLKLR